MSEKLRLARFYFLLLAIVTIVRWLLGTVYHTPYEVVTDKFSIVILTLYSSIFYGAFCRRWQRYSVMQAVVMAAVLALTAQVVILLSTLASYVLGIDSYFNYPKALNVTAPIGLGAALMTRLQGLIGNTVINAVAGALGWAMGALLPEGK